MKRHLSIAVFGAFAVTVWGAGPLVAIAGNALLRPGYQVRDLGSEYRARLLPNRVRWYEYRLYRMDCGGDQRRVVILHTSEFTESPLDFLGRKFPECSNATLQRRRLPSLFSGILLGRW